MLVRNENLQLVDISIYANEILTEGLGENTVTEQDAKNALAELYLSANQQIGSDFFIQELEAFIPLKIESLNVGKIWAELKKIFCSIVQEDSTFGKIVDLILEAIAYIIPLGVFIKKLVKVIIKFFLQQGLGRICPAN